jgi:hypothetical protein
MPRSFASGLHHFVGGENAGIPSINVNVVLILQRLKFLIVTDLRMLDSLGASGK